MANGERRPIPGYPGYFVTEDGKVFQFKRLGKTKYDTAVPVATTPEGKVNITGPDKAYHTIGTARLVAMAFPETTPPMSQSEEELAMLIEAAKEYVMSDAEKEAQRRLFVFGNVALSNPEVTRETVNEVADKLEAEQPKTSKKKGKA